MFYYLYGLDLMNKKYDSNVKISNHDHVAIFFYCPRINTRELVHSVPEGFEIRFKKNLKILLLSQFRVMYLSF